MQQAAGFSDKIKRIFTFERLFLLILLAAIIVRFWQLDLKLFHHDEAIHSWFSYTLLTTGSWVYDPSYHGPFLYYVTAGMFSLFGASDLVARLMPALFGTLLIPLVYYIYRLGYLSKAQTLVVALFIAISPDMVYFSRFLRHDIFMLFFTLLLLVALLYYFERQQSRFAIIAAIAAAGGLCCKEEMPLFLLIFGSFFIFAVWRGKFTLPPQWKKDLVLGLLVLAGILAVLYSAFGAHPETLLSGGIDAITHWVSMSNEQRLGGPWFFYIPLFLLYEVPIFVLAIIGVLQFMLAGDSARLFVLRAKNWLFTRRYQLSAGELALASTRQLKSPPLSSKSEEFFRLCIYWMLLSMAFYAYVGEKVPWLIIHQLLPMCFVAVYRLNWQKIVFALIGCGFLLLMTSHIAFTPTDINEPIVQVQNSEDMRQVMQIMDNSSSIVLASKNYWPLPWYYRGDRWNKITFYGDVVDEHTLLEDHPDMIILWDGASYPSLPGYNKTTYKLDYWFSIYDNEDRLPQYYFYRDGTMGSINLDIFTRQPG